ncbi:MAG TPA: VWA domain-containing protein [Pyrinomonadaceae bacterium]|nr:VWA domain-containing protein [Pyrinomonadaceae bacterium]
MGRGTVQILKARRSAIVALAAFIAAISLMIGSASRAQQPDSRPRQTGTATPSPTATPTQTGPGRRVAPQLGAPPPPPILRPKPTPTPDPTTAEISENDILKINTELVTLHVRVIDRNNHPINRLGKDEFKVLEDGVPQQIFSFTEEEVPVIYGLAVDTSGSVRPQFQQIIDAAKTIINSNKKGDESFIERFISSDKIETVQDFTASKDLLLDGLDTLYVEGGQTAVVDGVYLAAEHVAEYKKGGDDDRRRRALIVVTDGEDRASYYQETQLFQRLREEDVQIFVIGFVNELDAEKGLIRKSPRDKAVALINRLATDTGGRAFFPQSISELPQIANEIVRDLRTQYVISYDPTNKAHDGTYRSIKVSVSQPGGEKRIALTRNGRTAGLPGSAKPAKATPTPANNARQPANNTPRKSP